jgi:V-type H+-transporting ATPase subunit a
MDILIIVKWLTDWGLYSPVAPSVITTLIDLPLRFGKMQLQMFEGQAALQPWLVIIAIICIPWILIPKPVLVSYAIKR